MAIAEFLEPAVEDYAEQAKATYSAPIDTSKFTGRQFVAGEDPLQTQAINLAQQGVGSYQPYLQAATKAQALGAGALGQSAANYWWTRCLSNCSRKHCTRCSRYDRTTSLPTFYVSVSITSY
jgi:hypothetical protein